LSFNGQQILAPKRVVLMDEFNLSKSFHDSGGKASTHEWHGMHDERSNCFFPARKTLS
jgi:hypothetical protein